jgi:hypothetical protein
MNNKYQIIDNILSKKNFLTIQNYFLNNLNWSYNRNIVNDEKTNYMLDNYMFNHIFYRNNPFTISKDIQLIAPIFDELNILELYRCKSNFYSRTNEIIRHNYHTDMNFKHLVALYFVNSNNGLTIIKDVVEVESIENRLLIFDGDLEHASTTASDNIRINININFIQRDCSTQIKKEDIKNNLTYQ